MPVEAFIFKYLMKIRLARLLSFLVFDELIAKWWY